MHNLTNKLFISGFIALFVCLSCVSVTGCAPKDDMHIVTDPNAPRDPEPWEDYCNYGPVANSILSIIKILTLVPPR